MSTGYLDQYAYPYWVNVTTEYLTAMGYTQPGYFFYNNSACHLNSHVLYESTGDTPKEFAEENLFPYLGIENPDWLYGYNGINDGSASLELTLREMVKLGQLYLQDGYSGDTQILSSNYIQEATSFKIDTGFGYGYGFLFWIPYGEEESFEAKGYGGQNIFVYPNKNLVIGTHSYFNSSGSYQNFLNSYIENNLVPIFDN
jgi:CubicO group peptidase (beta-lactamase class C family)